ncbi:MAG: NUDIX domain-containing protein [Nanoarchaeota archaeon]
MKEQVEYLDIVDDDDTVIGKVTWKEMMDKGLLHKTANVIVFNSKGEVFVHRRADNLSLYPGLWDVKFGGSARSGETYEEAAERELREEANITRPRLVELFSLKFRSKENNVNREVFKCVYDGPIKLDRSEVAEGKFVNVEEVKKMLMEGKLSPAAVNVFTEFLKRKEVKM